MNSFLNRLFFGLIIALIFGSSLYCNGLPAKKIRNAYDFSLHTLDGKSLRLSDYRGKIVLLNFWATWCAPCIREMPLLERLNREYEDEGLQVIGIAIVSKREDVPKKTSESAVTYPVCFGDKQLIAEYGYFTSIPQTFLIDRDGKIIKEFSGSSDESVLEKEIKSVLFE